MNPARPLALLLCIGLGSASTAFGQDNGAVARQHQRIAADRAAAEARYTARRQVCVSRFVVTSCVEDAKRERRETLQRLRQEQNLLDDSLRKARARERTEAIRNRSAAEAQRERDAVITRPLEPAAPRAPRVRASRPADASAAAASGVRSRDHKSGESARDVSPSREAGASSASKAMARREHEARSRATFDAALRAAEAHRLEVEQRNSARAVKHKPAAPLQLPPGASSP